MTYIRYFIGDMKGSNENVETGLNPSEQASINGNNFNTSDFGVNYGQYTVTGGVDYTASQSAGNRVNQAFSGGSFL